MTNRREFLRTAAGAAAAPFLKAAPSRKPNFLVLLADDMGYSDARCYGGDIDTPNLDRMSANGLRFTQAYSTARCGPSRGCLLTGQYAQQTASDVMTPGNIPSYVRFIPNYLKPLGYRSYHSGKWHMRHVTGEGGVGFDHSYTMMDELRFFTQNRHLLDGVALPKPDPGYYSKTADIEIAAKNTRISKTSDNGSGCSADGNLLVDGRIYDKFLEALQKEGGYLVTPEEKKLLQKAMWDEENHRTSATIARPAKVIAELAGFKIGDDKKFLIVPETHIGKEYLFSSEKLSPVLSIIRYEGFDEGLKKVEQIYQVGGRGHSCGIYSHDDDHIHRLALLAPVSRMMVRQPQSKANAGAWDNGMPMTSSMGCGIWGGNITNENVNVKHYMQLTWVSRPIPEDRPSEQELFGEFYNTETP